MTFACSLFSDDIKRRVLSVLFVNIPDKMWQEDDEESFDDKPERFILCAIHQGIYGIF